MYTGTLDSEFGIREMVDANSVVGEPITAGDVTIIPISKISIGYGGGGTDFTTKNSANQELLEKYPDTPEAVEANFLCGNILADLGETNLALTHFKKAEKQRVSGIFAEIISGRIADCSLSLYTGSDFDRHLVEDALKRYLKLAEEAKLPAVKLQSICKAGNCYARMGNHRKAVENYEKTLYFAALLKNNHFQPDPVWCARAAYGGARAAFKGRKPEGLVRALRLIRHYEKLDLPGTGEDFGTLCKQLHDAYNLLKRKGK